MANNIDRAISDAVLWSLIAESLEGDSSVRSSSVSAHAMKSRQAPAGLVADDAAQMARLGVALEAAGPEGCLAFAAAFDRALVGAYTWDLWAAAYVIHGGASDDAFEYFRCWLIAQGQDVYDNVRASPDKMADLIPADRTDWLENEEIRYLAGDVWTRLTGQEITTFYTAVASPPHRTEPRGRPFTEEDGHLEARLPALWARFGETPL